MGNAARLARWTILVAGLACFAAGCAGTLDYSRGRSERVLDQRVVSSQPVREEPAVDYAVRGHRLMLKVAQRKMCQRQILQSYQVVERVEHVAQPGWWFIPTLGVAMAGGGVALLKYAPNAPTEGTDSEGKPSHPREDMYVMGSILLGVGLLAMLDFPIVGVRDHARESNTRTVSEKAPCGTRPYSGPVRLTRAGRTMLVETNGSGGTVVDLSALANGEPPSTIMLEVEELNLQKSLDLTASDLAQLGI
jgi:hypothetical protein